MGEKKQKNKQNVMCVGGGGCYNNSRVTLIIVANDKVNNFFKVYNIIRLITDHLWRVWGVQKEIAPLTSGGSTP